jgi:hypothetical protein
MRRLLIAAAAVATLIGAGSLTGTRAEAMPLAGLSGAVKSEAEPVYLRCRRFWNGYRWVRSCVEVYGGPAYYAPRYYAPRPYYGYGYRGYYRGW